MITALETYMDALYTGMHPMPAEERLRIVRETAQRIRERAARLQMREEDLIADMESPGETARKFRDRWQAQQMPPVQATRDTPPAADPKPADRAETKVPETRTHHATFPWGKLALGVLLLPVMLVVAAVVLGAVLVPVTAIVGAVFAIPGIVIGQGLQLFGWAIPQVIGLAVRVFVGIILFKVGIRVLRSIFNALRPNVS